jgi:ribosomal protein S18 acetylase RimI-like enzyme
LNSSYNRCHLCEKHSEFQCSVCNQFTCGNDGRIRIVCTDCLREQKCTYSIHPATCDDVATIEEMVQLFWGDPVQLMFERQYTVAQEPAIVAESDKNIIGFISYSDFNQNTVLIVALGILPGYQGCGIGQVLVKQIEEYARGQGKQQLLVVTSNDNLPALAFYQRLGFQLYDVATDVIAKKLGGLHLGIANIPIRDELRLRKVLSKHHS